MLYSRIEATLVQRHYKGQIFGPKACTRGYQVLRDYNTTCDGQNNYRITNRYECDIASNLLALELPHFISTHSEHETKRNCPKGCYFHVTNRQVYWNNHYAGSNVNSSLRICRAPVPCNTDSDCTDAQYCYHSNKYCKDNYPSSIIKNVGSY